MTQFYQLNQVFAQCLLAPDSIAINTSQQQYSFAQLDYRAQQLASFLLSQHITYGDVVAIASTKTFDDYALMLACIKLGVIYTHVDSDNPTARLMAIFEQCQVKAIFGELALDCDIEVIDYQHIAADYSVKDLSSYSDAIDGDSIAYIMFTSGSTGTPKGVAVSHQNLLHFICWVKTRYQISNEDNFAQLSPLYFDNSVFDFYGGLFNGASLTPITKTLLTQPMALVDYIDQQQCSIWFSVPSLLIYLLTMRVLRAGVLASIRVFTFGGEGFAKSELKKLYDLYHHHAELINVYGPTECTCICSSYTISDADFETLSGLPPLGPLNPNFSSVIVNDAGEVCDEGELWLLGPLVAKGYYRDSERSQAVFDNYTGNGHYNKPMYRTGDLVKRIGDMLHFVGRVDNQIKHQGYRIELEEIEFVLNGLACVSQAMMVYHRTHAGFGKLVAFVIKEQGFEDLDGPTLIAQLTGKLPSYMLPGRVEFVAEFARNANGKADRKQLTALL